MGASREEGDGEDDDRVVCSLEEYVSTLARVALAGGLSAGYTRVGGKHKHAQSTQSIQTPEID